MRLGKWTAFLPPLVVVVAWADFAQAQGNKDLVDAPVPADVAEDGGAASRMMLASGILTFGSSDYADGAVIATSDRDSDADKAYGPFTIIDSLLNPDKGAGSRPRKSPAKPTIHVSPVALGAGGYGMLATATF